MKIALVITSFLAIYFFARGFALSLQNIKLKELIQEQDASSPLENDIVKESFLKFVSDSREWAFEYIEEVQKGLNKFVKEVEPHIDYFDKYGEVMWTPLTPMMKDISKSFNELKKLLPEESND